LIRSAQDVGCFGHEMDAAKHDVRTIRPLGGNFGEQQRVPAKIRVLWLTGTVALGAGGYFAALWAMGFRLRDFARRETQ